MVVEDGRAARKHQLRKTGARCRVLGLCVDSGPGRVELDEPFEQRRLLCPGARERLVEVVVRVDKAGRNDRAAESHPLVRLRLLAGAYPRDESVFDQNPAVRMLGSGVVDGEDVRVGEQGLHACVPYL